MKRRTAFTLVELVLVIVLTAILAAGALGALRGLGRWRDAAALKRLVADLRHARSLAIFSGTRTMIVFDLNQQSWQLQRETAPASGAFRGSTITHPQTYRPWQVRLSDLAAGLRITSIDNAPRRRIGFDARGLPLDAGGALLRRSPVIRLNNGRSLTVYAGSGLCEVRG